MSRVTWIKIVSCNPYRLQAFPLFTQSVEHEVKTETRGGKWPRERRFRGAARGLWRVLSSESFESPETQAFLQAYLSQALQGEGKYFNLLTRTLLLCSQY